MKKEYKEAFSEVDKILELMPKALSDKIPYKFKEIIKKEKSETYIPNITEPIDECNLKEKTVIILALIYRDFLCGEEERKELKARDTKSLEIFEKELKEEYNSDDLLKYINKKVQDDEAEKSLAILQEEKWYQKIFNIIKGIFKKDKITKNSSSGKYDEEITYKENKIFTKENISTIFFDLDDTLINSIKAEYNAICEFKKSYSAFSNAKDVDFAKTWNRVTLDNYDIYHSGKLTFEELRIKRMRDLFEIYNVRISEDEAMEKFKEYQTIYEKNWILFEDTINVLEKLKDNFKLAIITNGNKNNQIRKIERTGIKEYFSEFIFSSEVNVSKPDKKIFEIACERTNSTPKGCIMIGDRYGTDIIGAVNTGLNAIWINRNNEQENYEYKINELSEIMKYINV